jgi:hypothetical protein
MTTRFLQLYCALFLVEQLMGIGLAVAGFASPAWQLVWAGSFGNSALGALTLVLSVPAALVALRRGPRPIAVLPAWHLAGLLLFEKVQRAAAETVAREAPGLSPALLRVVALQSADVQFAALLHSVLGLVLGLQLVLLAAPADRRAQELGSPVRVDRATAR